MSNYEVFLPEGGVPIKAWVKGVPVEDAAIEQLSKLARMPFIYKHVAVMPDVHVGIGSTVGSVIATRGAVIPAAVGVDLGCFVGETKIPLLDGTQATLEELAYRGGQIWVYSVNSEGTVVPGLARAIRTRENADLMKVVVSGGDEIICTPDHEFLLIDGSYCQAKDLTFNTSLMPLYRKWQSRDGYESATSGRGRAKLTHILVWEFINGSIPEGYVVHHINHNHFDNRPENLQLMTVSEHSIHHRLSGHRFDNSDPEFQAARMQGILVRVADPIAREKMNEIGTANIVAYMRERPEHFAAATAGNGARGATYLRKFNTTPRECSDCGVIVKNPSVLRWHKKNEHSYNHKVISVEFLSRTAVVYCLQVEDYHNFALAAGVFVHNCGMVAVQTSLKASDLPDTLQHIRGKIEAAVPHGRTANGGPGDRGAWTEPPARVWNSWGDLEDRFFKICQKHPSIEKSNNVNHLGTLGTGNHFIEVCLDESQNVWVMLHSGSRGVGGRIGSYFIALAKEDMRKWFINLPDMDLAYLPEGTKYFDDYLEAVSWAQDFAMTSRQIMLGSVLEVLHKTVRPFTIINDAINCHHNYISRENHFGSNVIVTRKGAVQAREGTMGIIPGSMGAKSFIVRGKGNPESFCSCSHGAGRKMSRGAAKKIFSLEDHALATAGVECRKDVDVIDETPGAYKSIEDVMNAQKDLVDIVVFLKQVLCVKG